MRKSKEEKFIKTTQQNAIRIHTETECKEEFHRNCKTAAEKLSSDKQKRTRKGIMIVTHKRNECLRNYHSFNAMMEEQMSFWLRLTLFCMFVCGFDEAWITNDYINSPFAKTIFSQFFFLLTRSAHCCLLLC
jgi:hypothetical protein